MTHALLVNMLLISDANVSKRRQLSQIMRTIYKYMCTRIVFANKCITNVFCVQV